jgi:hypothetical protein
MALRSASSIGETYRNNRELLMNVWVRKGLAALIGIAGIVGIGVAYNKCVVPQQAVWDTEKDVHWDRSMIPLKVNGEYKEALVEAVKLWNDQADCDLFVIHESPTIVVVQGTIEVGQESEDWAAHADVVKVGGKPTRGIITVHVPLMVGTDLVVLHHELGHELGLAHDRSRTMKPIAEEEVGGRQEMVLAQDKDIDALNERYCKAVEDED